jgi:acetoacetyl-CoA synthetase
VHLVPGEIVWRPSPESAAEANLTAYTRWLAAHGHPLFTDYESLREWSVRDISAFWKSIWDFFEVGDAQPEARVLIHAAMPGTTWFPDATVNFTEFLLREDGPGPAVIAHGESAPGRELSWAQLRAQVASVAGTLRSLGVVRGDRVAAYLPNIPESLVAFLAAASIGAVWSICSPDFGSEGALQRLAQIEPKVLFTVETVRYAGKVIDRRTEIEDLCRGLASLERVVLVESAGSGPTHAESPDAAGADIGGVRRMEWHDFLRSAAGLSCEPLPFMAPLWVVYTSGTTGPPKALVHSHGGVLLEFLKNAAFANNRKTGDRVLWATSTSWILWNMLIGNLAARATIILYDGSVTFPDRSTLWRLAERTRATVVGTSPALIERMMADGPSPRDRFDLSTVHTVSLTGAPVSAEVARWTIANAAPWLVVGSGGTDVATGLVGSSPWVPVRAGYISTRLLGVDAQVFDESGRAVTDEVGELVVTQPMPSMPLFIWGDEDGSRYADSYFSTYPGIWRQGDWARIGPDGTVLLSGRSDATINRRGQRIGSSEIYLVVEALEAVLDSLVVDLVLPSGEPCLALFIVPQDGIPVDDDLRSEIVRAIRRGLSPRFVPDVIAAIHEVPRTLTGKKLEVPVKRILLGSASEAVVARQSVANFAALAGFEAIRDQGVLALNLEAIQ